MTITRGVSHAELYDRAPTRWIGSPVVITDTKLSRYNFTFYQPGAEAVDVFTLSWGCENNWIFSPVSKISKVIAHARACKAAGTLVFPMWKSSYFLVLLCDDS